MIAHDVRRHSIVNVLKSIIGNVQRVKFNYVKCKLNNEESISITIKRMTNRKYDLSIIPTNAKERYERGQYILKLSNELPEQRTPEWFAERRTCITASEIHNILTCKNIETNKGVQEMIESKRNRQCKQGFSDCQSTRWGEKYEPTSVQIYEKKYNVKIHEAPLLIKGDIGASCDGIVMIEPDSLCKEQDAECIEIKNPFSRDPGKIPQNYMSQMQTQLYVTGLEICNFFDCKVEEWLDESEFINDVQCYINEQATCTLTSVQASTLTSVQASTDVYGIIAQFVNLQDQRNIRVLTDPNSYYTNTISIDPNENYKIVPLHLYSDIISADFSDFDKVKSDLEERVAQRMQCDNLTFIRYYYWKLVKFNHIRVQRDPEWFNNGKDKLNAFWRKVES
jgi:putative phage-type endonuclease